MKHVLEFFHDIIPVVFVVGIIAIAFIFYNHTKNQATSALEKTYTFDAELYNSDILIYDGMTISGFDVIDFVKKFYKTSNTIGYFPITINNVNSGMALITDDVSSNISSKSIYICEVKTSSGNISVVNFVKQ